MSLKINGLLIMILALSFPFKTVAQENNAGAADLQNISSPNGLEEIVPKPEEIGQENETIYQIQNKPKNSGELIDNMDEEVQPEPGENESQPESETGSTETEPGTEIFKIGL